MTVLSAPTPLNQLTDGARAPGWDCGEETNTSDVRDFLQRSSGPPYASDVENFCSANWSWWSPSQGTWDYMLIAHYVNQGLGAGRITGRILDYLPVALARGHRCKILVQDNNGAPVPAGSTQYSHWMTAYGMDGAGIHVMNPWGGVNVTYSAALIDSADFGAGGIELGSVMPGDVIPNNVPIVGAPQHGGLNQMLAFHPTKDWHMAVCMGSQGGKLYFSTNYGDAWTEIPGAGSTCQQPSVAVDAAVDRALVMCIGNDHRIYRQGYNISAGQWDGHWTQTLAGVSA